MIDDHIKVYLPELHHSAVMHTVRASELILQVLSDAAIVIAMSAREGHNLTTQVLQAYRTCWYFIEIFSVIFSAGGRHHHAGERLFFKIYN